ncbi:hypothetical protein BH23PLA1_BH23PLA1_26760 [soil metagenome]
MSGRLCGPQGPSGGPVTLFPVGRDGLFVVLDLVPLPHQPPPAVPQYPVRFAGVVEQVQPVTQWRPGLLFLPVLLPQRCRPAFCCRHQRRQTPAPATLAGLPARSSPGGRAFSVPDPDRTPRLDTHQHGSRPQKISSRPSGFPLVCARRSRPGNAGGTPNGTKFFCSLLDSAFVLDNPGVGESPPEERGDSAAGEDGIDPQPATTARTEPRRTRAIPPPGPGQRPELNPASGENSTAGAAPRLAHQPTDAPGPSDCTPPPQGDLLGDHLHTATSYIMHFQRNFHIRNI